jgi:hypothetical protein
MQEFHGISGLCQAKDGTFWVVPERQRFLLPLTLANARLTLGKPLPFSDIGKIDAESIACTEDGFILGTEGSGTRTHDELLWVTLKDGRAQITQRLTVNYSLWDMHAKNNQGIEGVCYSHQQLLVAGETASRVSNTRAAPMARYDLQTKTWNPFWLALTSDKGKISDITCRLTGNKLDVWGIERHFSISKILHFRVPINVPKHTLIQPEISYDVTKVLGDIPNFEGIAYVHDQVMLISDNHYGIITGPTIAVMLSR